MEFRIVIAKIPIRFHLVCCDGNFFAFLLHRKVLMSVFVQPWPFEISKSERSQLARIIPETYRFEGMQILLSIIFMTVHDSECERSH